MGVFRVRNGRQAMSEYQYYEFLAIDRSLTDAETRELRSISSRAEITRTRFSNHYNYGDLKADPRKLLERYFDAHVYVANWGTRRLALRFPADVVELVRLKRYCVSEHAALKKVGDSVLLDAWSEAEDDDHWVDESSWMASLAPVRGDVLTGDLRGPYLLWLVAVQNEELDADDEEPSVPPGLGELSAPLRGLAEFLRVDEHLLAAAAERSESLRIESPKLAEWIAALPSAEKDALLLDVARGEHLRVGMKLLRRFQSENVGDASGRPARTVGALIDRAESLRSAHRAALARQAERERRRREKAASAARSKRLDAIAKRRAAAWRDVEKLISLKKAKPYDEAVTLLKDLHDLGVREGDSDTFTTRLLALRARHERKRTFMARLEQAGLSKT